MTRAQDTFGRDRIEQDLVRDEGLRLKVYRCTADKRTIGVGRNLDAIGIRDGETAVLGITLASCLANGITNWQALVLLSNDIDVVVAQLDRKLPWWRSLSPRRQRVMINMTFNLGIDGLLKFKNTLRFVRDGQYKVAANNMLLSLWARQVGKRAVRLADDMERGG